MSIQKFGALRDFREFWKRLDIGDVRRTGRFKIFANIIYNCTSGIVRDQANVTILFDGYDQGQIDIDETDRLTVDQFHLRFSPDFQDYIFDEDYNTLLIEGSSTKMGGDYSVRIHPVN